jgi:hypothetical protein
MEGVEADDLVEEARGPFIGAVAEYDLDPVAIAVLHFLHPEFAGGDAIGVGQQDDLVQGFFDAHAQRVFFTGNADGFVFEVDDMEAFEGLFEFVQQEAGVVLAVVVDDDDFVGAGIGWTRAPGRWVTRRAASSRAQMMTLTGCCWECSFRGRIPGQPSEEPTIVKQLYQGDQTKNNKKQFEPGETPKQFSHKCAVRAPAYSEPGGTKVQIFGEGGAKDCIGIPPIKAEAFFGMAVNRNLRRIMAALQFELELTSCPHSAARAGRIITDHGEILTPIFMPVGTVGSVKAVTQQQLKEDVKAQIILGNTYHLYLRPGLEVLERRAGCTG